MLVQFERIMQDDIIFIQCYLKHEICHLEDRNYLWQKEKTLLSALSPSPVMSTELFSV